MTGTLPAIASAHRPANTARAMACTRSLHDRTTGGDCTAVTASDGMAPVQEGDGWLRAGLAVPARTFVFSPDNAAAAVVSSASKGVMATAAGRAGSARGVRGGAQPRTMTIKCGTKGEVGGVREGGRWSAASFRLASSQSQPPSSQPTPPQPTPHE